MQIEAKLAEILLVSKSAEGERRMIGIIGGGLKGHLQEVVLPVRM